MGWHFGKAMMARRREPEGYARENPFDVGVFPKIDRNNPMPILSSAALPVHSQARASMFHSVDDRLTTKLPADGPARH